MKKTMKGQGFSMEAIVGGLITVAILLIVGVYVVTVVGNQFTTGASSNVNQTVGNVTNMFAQVAPLLVIVGIVAFVVVVLGFVKLLGYGQGGRAV